MSSRYGGDRFKRGLIYFALGKVVSGICGFLAMVLVVRLLSVQSFAHYSILVSFIEIFSAFSAMGLSHVLLRFVPELYAKHYHHALKQLVVSTFCIRTAVLLLMIALSVLFASPISTLFAMSSLVGAFKLYLIIVVLRSTLFFLSQILESTLHQKVTQLAFVLSTVVRLIGMVVLTQAHTVSLADVIWVEIISDIFGLGLMLYGIADVLADKHQTSDPKDSTWLVRHLPEIRNLAATGYAQHIVGLPFGSNTNRLVGGYFLPTIVMASFGFAQSMYEYVKRYLPAQLLIGLVRPVVVARYAKQKNFAESARIGASMMLINIALIGTIVLLLLVAGKPILACVSHGKYQSGALAVLLALMAVLALETQRLILEMLAQTVQRYDILIGSNLALSLSIIPVIFYLPKLGAISFPLANGLFLLACNFWVRFRLKQAGYTVLLRSTTTINVALILLCAAFIGFALNFFGVPELISALIAEAIYLYAVWRKYGAEMIKLYTDLAYESKPNV